MLRGPLIAVPAMARPRARRDALRLIFLGTLLAAPFVFTSVLTRFAWFDDEGTLMAWHRSFLDGHRMYDEVYALYGPVYFDLYAIVFGWLHVPLTHDSWRILAGLLWLCYAGLFGLLCFRITRSLATGTLAYVIGLVWLRVLVNSPGHPEEIGLLLMAAAMLLASDTGRLRRPAVLASVGVTVVALALTKVNFGAYVGGALGLVLLMSTTRSAWTVAAARVTALLLVLMPVAIQSLLFEFEWVRLYSVFAVFTIGPTALLVALSRPSPILRLADWGTIVAGGVVAGVVFVGAIVLAGSSPYAVLNAVLLQNASFIRNWSIPLGVGFPGVGIAVLSAALAVAWRFAGGRSRDTVLVWPVIVVKAGFVLVATGLAYWDSAIFRALLPFCWLLLVMPTGTSAKQAAARTVMAMVGAMMVLYPFPVAGSQVRIAGLIPMLTVAIMAHDVYLEAGRVAFLRRFATPFALSVAMLAPALTIALCKTYNGVAEYVQSEPLGLPGAGLIRVPQSQAEDLQWALRQLSTCDAIYSVPGQPSFGFWAGHSPITPVNVNAVLNFISPAQQEHIVASLSEVPNLCIVFTPNLLRFFDRGQVATKPPLLRWMNQDFVASSQRGGLLILRRPIPPRPSANHLLP